MPARPVIRQRADQETDAEQQRGELSQRRGRRRQEIDELRPAHAVLRKDLIDREQDRGRVKRGERFLLLFQHEHHERDEDRNEIPAVAHHGADAGNSSRFIPDNPSRAE